MVRAVRVMRVVVWLYGLFCFSLLWSVLVLKHSLNHLVSEYLRLHGSSNDSYGMACMSLYIGDMRDVTPVSARTHDTRTEGSAVIRN